MKNRLIIAVVATAFALPVLAQTAPAPSTLDQRQAAQQKRIDQGVKSGSLTDKEAAQLQKKQDKLARHEERAKSDGVVTRQETRRLDRQADRNSRDIARKKHNKRTAQ